MNQRCDVPGVAHAAHAQFPDPAFDPAPASTQTQTAVFAAGCFWCVEAVFKPLRGVLAVTSGYSGGSADSASYEAVCSGSTDHAEVLRIDFDPQQITFGRLLKVLFCVAHDPTQVDRQGNDRGRQYRSAVFYLDDQQRATAAAYIRQLDAAHVFTAPIATQVVPLQAFYTAEAHHQDYAARNPAQPYITHVAAPKVHKLHATFGDWLAAPSSDRSTP